MYELTKAEKRLARAVINVGLQRDFKRMLDVYYDLLQKWKVEQPEDNGETHRELYGAIRENDKYIARRYDSIGNDDLVLAIIGQINTGLLFEDDLAGFSEEKRLQILAIADRLKNE